MTISNYFKFSFYDTLTAPEKKMVSIQIYDYTEINHIFFTTIGELRNGLFHQYRNVKSLGDIQPESIIAL